MIVGAAVWGLTQGLSSTLALVGFAIGAVLGTRAPLLVGGGGLHSSFSLVSALPAAIVLGALLGALVERLTLRQQARIARYGAVNALGGGLLAAGVAVITVWILGPVASEVASLRPRVERSTIVAKLDAVLTPAGPAFVFSRPPPLDSFPVYAGPAPDVAPVDASVINGPIRTAMRQSTVKINVLYCHGVGVGSGWVAGNGIVVTAAHVAASAQEFAVQVDGRGPGFAATVIWFDPHNDFAILRVPGLAGAPPLPIVHRPQVGTAGAALGFPLGRWAIRPARLGPTTKTLLGTLGGHMPGLISRNLFGRLVTTFLAAVQPGNSGGPVVDTSGRVLTTTFAGSGVIAGPGLPGDGIGVANRLVLAALRRAGPPVSTGLCLHK